MNHPKKSPSGLSIRNLIGLLIVAISLVLLIPGLTLPMLTVDMDASLKSQFANIDSDILKQTQSIVSTIGSLFEKDKILVGILILLFSVVIPFLKCILLVAMLFLKNLAIRERIYNFISIIGKWSMADVFVVSMFLVYLSASGETTRQVEEIKVLGMVIPIQIETNLNSSLNEGYWYFLSYCLLSIFATMILTPKSPLYSKKIL